MNVYDEIKWDDWGGESKKKIKYVSLGVFLMKI